MRIETLIPAMVLVLPPGAGTAAAEGLSGEVERFLGDVRAA